nr:dockerin type I repeat-containing protein [Clostridiales bacterium]
DISACPKLIEAYKGTRKDATEDGVKVWQYKSESYTLFTDIGVTLTTEGVKIGDLNSDGSVNQKDLAMLSKYMRNSTLYPLNETAMAAADINGDGNVNQKDLAILSKYMRNPTAYPLP